MLKKYTDWFWSFFPPDTLEGSSSAAQSILELVPFVLGVVMILGFVFFLSSRRGESEESEEVALTELDKEIEAIRKLQRERR